jgi:hypothetical protein
MMSWHSLGLRFCGMVELPTVPGGTGSSTELGLHQSVDLAPDLAAGRGEQAQQADVLRQMVAKRTRRYRHGAEAQHASYSLLHGRSLLAQGGIGACGATQHGSEKPWRELVQTLDVAQQLIDPDRDLVAKGGGHRVLAMGAPGDRHLRGPLGKIRHGRQHFTDLSQEDRVGLAQHQQVAGLGDVLRRGAPMNPAAVRLAHDAAEFPDQRDEGVAGALEALVDARPVHQLELRFRGDGLGRAGGNDA